MSGAPVDSCAEMDQAFRGFDAFGFANGVERAIQRLRGFGAERGNHVEAARGRVQLFHCIEGFQPCQNGGCGAWFDRDQDRGAQDRLQVGPAFQRIACDSPTGFEPVQTGLDRGPRQPEFAGKIGHGQTRVFGQGGDQRAVGFVDLMIHVVSSCSGLLHSVQGDR